MILRVNSNTSSLVQFRSIKKSANQSEAKPASSDSAVKKPEENYRKVFKRDLFSKQMVTAFTVISGFLALIILLSSPKYSEKAKEAAKETIKATRKAKEEIHELTDVIESRHKKFLDLKKIKQFFFC